jgi:NAD(P)-dependent dehydrogenase (short-subunit alcohol dehydrogenase family)
MPLPRQPVRAGVAANLVSSVGNWSPTPRDLIYGAAKAGLNALTHGLATTLGPEVRVNAVLPGPLRTDITKAWDMGAFERAAVDAYALGRVGGWSLKRS